MVDVQTHGGKKATGETEAAKAQRKAAIRARRSARDKSHAPQTTMKKGAPLTGAKIAPTSAAPTTGAAAAAAGTTTATK
jgi:hypothetical protein